MRCKLLCMLLGPPRWERWLGARRGRPAGRPCSLARSASPTCRLHPNPNPTLNHVPCRGQVLSYYKIFGYPTGLGALVARKDALARLRPRYFGGGTLAACAADADFHRCGRWSARQRRVKVRFHRLTFTSAAAGRRGGAGPLRSPAWPAWARPGACMPSARTTNSIRSSTWQGCRARTWGAVRVRRAEGPSGYEDGTPSFLAIAALRQGWRLVARLGGLPAVERHTAALTRWAARARASGTLPFRPPKRARTAQCCFTCAQEAARVLYGGDRRSFRQPGRRLGMQEVCLVV